MPCPSLQMPAIAVIGEPLNAKRCFAFGYFLPVNADHDGSLAAFLKPVLTPSERTVAQVEGWILGVPGLVREPGLDRDGIQSHARH